MADLAAVASRIEAVERELNEVNMDLTQQLITPEDKSRLLKQKENLETRLAALEMRLAALEMRLTELQKEKNLLREHALGVGQVEGNFHPWRRVISVEAMQLVKRAVFLIKRHSSDDMRSSSDGGSTDGAHMTGGSGTSSPDAACYVGVGVFVTNKRAVTADHNLQSAAVGSTLDILLPELHVKQQVRVAARNQELDFAVLECEDVYPHHLQLFMGDPDLLPGEPLALCAFQLGIHEEVPEFSTTMGIMRADAVKLSKRKNHMIYTSQTWPGDSGAALVMYNGQLVGLHVEGVNALREAYERQHAFGERLSAVEDSLQLAAQSVASGCIALLCGAFASAVGASG